MPKKHSAKRKAASHKSHESHPIPSDESRCSNGNDDKSSCDAKIAEVDRYGCEERQEFDDIDNAVNGNGNDGELSAAGAALLKSIPSSVVTANDYYVSAKKKRVTTESGLQSKHPAVPGTSKHSTSRKWSNLRGKRSLPAGGPCQLKKHGFNSSENGNLQLNVGNGCQAVDSGIPFESSQQFPSEPATGSREENGNIGLSTSEVQPVVQKKYEEVHVTAVTSALQGLHLQNNGLSASQEILYDGLDIADRIWASDECGSVGKLPATLGSSTQVGCKFSSQSLALCDSTGDANLTLQADVQKCSLEDALNHVNKMNEMGRLVHYPTFKDAFDHCGRTKLMDNIKVSARLLSLLQDCGLLNGQHVDELLKISQQDLQIRRMLDMLQRGDDRLPVYVKFLAALYAENRDVVTKFFIKSTNIAQNQVSTNDVWLLTNRSTGKQFNDMSLVRVDQISSDFQNLSSSSSENTSICHLSKLPLEILEHVLMRAFVRLLKIYVCQPYESAYDTLASVCYSCWMTLRGWPQSRTKHWVKHRLFPYINYVCHPQKLKYALCVQSKVKKSIKVRSMTWCNNNIFVIHNLSDKILVYGPQADGCGPQHGRLTDITVKGLERPIDIVACTETNQLYISDRAPDSGCVWQVPLNGEQVEKLIPNKSTSVLQFRPWTLCLTSSNELLVVSLDELLLYDLDGIEVKHISPVGLNNVHHAVKTIAETFIISHGLYVTSQISEVSGEGHILRFFNDYQKLGFPCYISLDSDSKVFIADSHFNCILKLNHCLKFEAIVLSADRHGLVRQPRRLCSVPEKDWLIVGSYSRLLQIF